MSQKYWNNGACGRTKAQFTKNRGKYEKNHAKALEESFHVMQKHMERNGKYQFVLFANTLDGYAFFRKIFVVESNGYENHQKMFDTKGKKTIKMIFKNKPDANRIKKLHAGE